MENLQVKTGSAKYGQPQFKSNLRTVTTFLRHEEDIITVISGKESVNIEIYKNGTLLFAGDKYELFDILEQHKTTK